MLAVWASTPREELLRKQEKQLFLLSHVLPLSRGAKEQVQTSSMWTDEHLVEKKTTRPGLGRFSLDNVGQEHVIQRNRVGVKCFQPGKQPAFHTVAID